MCDVAPSVVDFLGRNSSLDPSARPSLPPRATAYHEVLSRELRFVTETETLGGGSLDGRMPTSQAFLGTSAVNLESACKRVSRQDRVISYGTRLPRDGTNAEYFKHRTKTSKHKSRWKKRSVGRLHVARDDADASTSQSKPTRKRAVVKNHKCGVCGKAFSRNSSLKRHVATHTGKKPYACLCCPATFARKWSLENHNVRPQGLCRDPPPPTHGRKAVSVPPLPGGVRASVVV
ncbi:hypothetical protein HPB52_009510 [Rhipicephalus sanguineus]|uniref:C2H2-type domain-containing protein n=1 Tax=Rhipicephalus sanguineus TaxID=34632 RepID=A0A9D4SNA8_RHISA|nr:hypothetical protein HPB52_009510 [Rhipicephalus sanguineus]